MQGGRIVSIIFSILAMILAGLPALVARHFCPKYFWLGSLITISLTAGLFYRLFFSQKAYMFDSFLGAMPLSKRAKVKLIVALLMAIYVAMLIWWGWKTNLKSFGG